MDVECKYLEFRVGQKCNFIDIVSVPPIQCARTETAHGCELPTFDRHADSQDFLLY